MDRVWTVDAARGIALVMMVLSNFLFDLWLFTDCLWCYAGNWVLFARFTAGLFLFLVGVSLTLSLRRAASQDTARFWKYGKRGLRIFGYGLLLTAVTLIMFPDQFIQFGILHLIGVSIILAYPVLKRPFLAGGLGILVIALGSVIENVWWFLTWVFPTMIRTVDYTPVFPWFGVVLLGVMAGNLLASRLQETATPQAARPLTFLGRHSLLLYLIHQPILVGIIYLVF